MLTTIVDNLDYLHTMDSLYTVAGRLVIGKEIDKVVHHWEEAGIRVEKARWGRHNVIKGKVKVELAKTMDASKMTLEEAAALIEKNAPAKKARYK